jgi:hypothetical protein
MHEIHEVAGRKRLVSPNRFSTKSNGAVVASRRRVEGIGTVALYDGVGFFDHLLDDLFGFFSDFFERRDGRSGGGLVTILAFEDDEAGVGGGLAVDPPGAAHGCDSGYTPSPFEFEVEFLEPVVSVRTRSYDEGLLRHESGPFCPVP